MSSKKQPKSSPAPSGPQPSELLDSCFGTIVTLLDKLGTQIDETERGVTRAWHYSTKAYERKLDIQIALIEQVFGKELQRLDALHRTTSDDEFIDDRDPAVMSPAAESLSEGSAVFTDSEEEGVDDGSGVGLEESEEDEEVFEEESEEESEEEYYSDTISDEEDE
jgi:hypothetical protein